MGSFMLIRRSMVGKESLLDEGYFMYAEETDLCWQLKQAGRKVVYLPGATAVHQLSGSTSKNPKASAWAYGAKRRGILRFLCIRRGVPRAYLANILYLIDLLPRAVGWGLAELRRPSGKVRRVQIAAFHLKALLAPSTFRSPWTGPSP
jgi:GT2 family glycosyltransferase